MFNEELKNKYIELKAKFSWIPINYLNCQFNKTEKYEKLLSKDVCNFSTPEIIEYYKSLNVASLESLIVMNSHFSLYTQFCLEINEVKDEKNHFLEINNSLLKQCLNLEKLFNKIVDRKTILNWCEQLPNPRDQVIMLGLFEGLKGKDYIDLTNLKPKDIDFKNNIIKLHNRKICVSEILVKYIKNSISENVYYSTSGKGISTSILVDRGFVIKHYPNIKDGVSQFQEGRKIYNSIRRSISYVGANDASANSINESGKIYYIKKMANKNNMKIVDYIYSDLFTEIENRFNCNIAKGIFLSKYEDFLR